MISGTIKFDNAIHIWFGDEDGYMFLDGKRQIDDLTEILNSVWKLAEELSTKKFKEILEIK
jgi:hypothetical protein